MNYQLFVFHSITICLYITFDSDVDAASVSSKSVFFRVVKDGNEPTTSANIKLSQTNEISWILANSKSAFTYERFRLSKKLEIPRTHRFFITPLFYSDESDLTLNATLNSGLIQLPAGTCLLVVRFAQEANTRFSIRLQLIDSEQIEPIVMYESERERLKMNEVQIELNGLFERFRFQFVAQVQNSIQYQGHRFLGQVVFGGMQLQHT